MLSLIVKKPRQPFLSKHRHQQNEEEEHHRLQSQSHIEREKKTFNDKGDLVNHQFS
jgi:hypothetical protein